MKPPSAPPDARKLVAQARSAALVAGRAFDTAGALNAASEAAAWLVLVRRMHQVFKVKHAPGWHRDEILRLRR